MRWGDNSSMQSHVTELLQKPKIINWIEMPSAIGEDEHIEFLKNDIFLQRHEGLMDHILKLNKVCESESVYFFNLDKILSRNLINNNDALMFSKNFIQFINKYFSFKSLVHTNLIDDKLSNLFRSEGIAYIERNLEDKKNAMMTTLDMIKPFFSINNKVLRSYIRVNLEKYRYKVEILNTVSTKSPDMGIMKDLSVNGAGIILNNLNSIDNYNLKDAVSINMYVRQYLIKVQIGFVTRINKDENSLGVTFDINSRKMLSMMAADNLSKLIYHYLEEAIKKISIGNPKVFD